MVEGSILLGGAQVGKGTIVRNSVVGPRAIIHRDCIIRGLSVLGAECVVEEGNVLDCGALVNSRVCLPKRVVSF